MSQQTIWSLAEATGKPLSLVIFHAVLQDAWEPTGALSDEWAQTLRAVLTSARAHERPAPSAARPVGDVRADTHDEQPMSLADVAAAAALKLDEPVPASEEDIAALVSAGLGHEVDGQFQADPTKARQLRAVGEGDTTIAVEP